MVDILVIGSGAEALRDTQRYDTVTLNDLDVIARNLDAAIKFAKSISSNINVSFKMSILNKDKVVFRFSSPVEVHGIRFNIVECQIAWEGTPHRQIIDEYQKTNYWTVASFEDLYWIRVSHKYLKNSPHFHKTREAIGRLSKYKILGQRPNWYESLEAYHYTYKHPALNVSKQNFFTDDFYVYDHDHLHEIVAIGGIPAYKKFLIGEVQCSREKFDKLSHIEKITAVVEESLVLSIERSHVPHPGKLTIEQAYTKALEKVCTSITSGWFREFAYNHFDECSYSKWAANIYRGYLDFVDMKENQKIRPFVK